MRVKPDRSRLKSAVQQLSQQSSKFNWVGIYLLEGNLLKLGPFVGEATEHTEIPIGTGVCGTAVQQGSDQNVPDVSQRGNYLSCSSRTRSELVVLIRDHGGQIVGQIDIDSHTPHAFGAEEEAMVRQVAKELGETWNA